MSSLKQTIKYTATLSESSINELKILTENKIIPSVNFAIREAIETYIIQTKREIYEKQMKEASNDKEFLKRTFDCNDDFSFVDSEVNEDW